ncbi:Na+/H+ antiporter NhaC [Thalassorhabdus alkalitolerans]|uniref:Na+/H+ antiporter NhaC n=2 Tax=Bacillaceae TaxID=186817 RepID=A0ABW0YP94_9BACI
MENQKQLPAVTRIEALLVILVILSLIGTALIVFEAPPHVPIFTAFIFLVVYAFIKKAPWKKVEEGIVEGVSSGIIPMLIFMFIGVLISIWMSSGTIPTLIHYSFQVVSVSYFLPSVFIVTAIVGACVGSSFTTASTIGVSFMALGSLLGFDLAMVAGAVVSGALVGDKMSPLSDTTNLAASVTRVDLFEHIRHMIWTAVPAFGVSLLLFILIGRTEAEIETAGVNELMAELTEVSLISPIALLPAVVIVLLAIKRTPALPTMLAGIAAAFLIALIMQPQYTIENYISFIQDGYTAESGNEQIDALLTRGGIQDMMWPLSLLVLTLSMGGLLNKLGIIEKLLETIRALVASTGRLVLSTVVTGMGINITLGEQYMSVILTGKAYEKQYEELGLKRKNLSRALENGGTVINALIPYGVSGVFMASVLEVDVLSYLPYAFFCLLCPIIAVIYGFTGITMEKTEEK